MKKFGIILSSIPERFASLDIESLTKLNNCSEIELTIVIDLHSKVTPNQEILELLKDCGIKVLSGYFGNPGLTRNHGLINSQSEWVLFWDDDDIPNYDFATELAQGNLLDSKHALHVFEYVESNTTSFQNINFSNSSDFDSNCSSLATRLGIWRCVFLRRRLGNLFFPSLIMGEDQCFMYVQNFSNSEICFHHKNLYTYLKHSGNQLTSQKLNRKRVLEAWNLISSIESETPMNDLSQKLLCNIFVTSIVQCGFISVFRNDGLRNLLKNFRNRNFTLGNIMRVVLIKLLRRPQIA
jgi:hypothetical protein